MGEGNGGSRRINKASGMIDYIGQIKPLVDTFVSQESLESALEPVEVFQGQVDFDSPTELGEQAQRVAAQREFVAGILSEGRRILSVCDTIYESIDAEYQDALNVRLSEQAGYLIARGYAMDERRADAKTKLVGEMIQVRAVKMQRDRLATFVRLLDDNHREWRSNEFTLDRLVRITNLRLALSEV